MIEKMTFLSITGPKEDLDRMTETYLTRYEIQLEHAWTEERRAEGIAPFAEENPYQKALLFMRDVMQKYRNILQADEVQERRSRTSGRRGRDRAGIGAGNVEDAQFVSRETICGEQPAQAAETAESLRRKLEPLLSEKNMHKAAVTELEKSYRRIVPFIGLNYDIRHMLHFNSIKCSFGRMPVGDYQKMLENVSDSINVIISECTRDKEYVYLVYFVPKRDADQADAAFASLCFEKISIPDAYSGTPEESVNRLHAEISEHREQIFQIDMKIADDLTEHREEILSAADCLENYARLFEIRKYAALTKRGTQMFYILCGWMTARQAEAFRKETEQDDRLFCGEMNQDDRPFCYEEKEGSKLLDEPPTKLRQFALFRPFALFLERYGLPSYYENDPIPLMAVSYMSFFGFLSGDLGQGAVLFFGGALLYWLKGLRLAGIISCCGLSSMAFGLLFGAVFGFGGIIPPLWQNPLREMAKSSWSASLNAAFFVSVAAGVAVELLCMSFYIVRAWRKHQRGDVLRAGLRSHFFKPISFIRIGAVAASYAVMMGAVMMLAGAESGENLGLPVMIAGNLFICGMEGLIIGVQVLYLGYCELFSGYYKGGGRAFQPYGKENA